ncbi:MAG: two-component system NtrC family nitrogen regulation sensor histidine kinase GlnL [Nitrospirae bacterium]|nr:MAG: two-component system NtrC family nitrogen regulation sensor histidine kinase GlnL [Nitrospirota bacterium]
MFSLEALINSLEDAIVLFDKKGVAQFVNRAGEEFFARSLKELTGKKFRELFPEEKIISGLIKKTISEERPFSGRGVDINIGKTINVDFNLSPFFVQGETKGAVLSLRGNIDIVEREDYQFDSLIYLLGTIAHEIKNPLGGIKGAAQLLRDKTQSAGIDEYTNLIIKETDRLNSILQNYLTISKKPLFHSVNIHEVLEKAFSILDIPMKNKGIILHKMYDPSIPRVTGDEGKLLQVFLNMIKNAIEALKKGGSLTVVTRVSREYVKQKGKLKRWAVVSIKDTGEGIPSEDIPKIFLPFYTKKKHGTGIGLALSKKIILDHKGFIKVESQFNKGTTFNIYIPFEGK